MAKDKKKKKVGENQKEKKGFRFSLSVRISLLVLITALVMSSILTMCAEKAVRAGVSDEMIAGLKLTTVAMEALADEYDAGDFSIDSVDNLMKGNFNITTHGSKIDNIVKGTDTEITYFYGKTRRATTIKDPKTGERIVGTDASDEVYNTVVKGGKPYESFDVVINGKPYYAYYTPMKNSDGKIAGMYFAGTPTADLEQYLKEKTATLMLIGIIIFLAAVVVTVLVVRSIRKGILSTSSAVQVLASGDLNAEVDKKVLKRGDELGDMAREVDQLRNELTAVMTKVKESAGVLFTAGNDLSQMASQTSSTADEIGHAVEDISKGAVSQAEEIENASAHVEKIGNMIGRITTSVENLDSTANVMGNAGNESVAIVKELSKSNDKTMDAIARIGEQVYATNESANKISEAIQLITSIAEETNLLSLNASIEAARAGEQGKGFAVVANQIQKLAEQSNESAQKIDEIIKNLLNDSENTVEVMGEVQQIVNEQKKKLDETKVQFENVNRGIAESRDETGSIKGQTDTCNVARVQVVDVISNLSAISEENAASTEETTASMQELNATINLLAESASSLTELSTELEKQIEFFKF